MPRAQLLAAQDEAGRLALEAGRLRAALEASVPRGERDALAAEVAARQPMQPVITDLADAASHH